MKKKSLFAILFMIAGLIQAQFITPGTGVNWTMDDLVANSGGVVVLTAENTYQISHDLTIAATDTLSVFQTADINVNQAVLITIGGVLFADLDDNDLLTVKSTNEDEFYKGLKFDNSPGSILNKVDFYFAGGIKLVSSQVEFTSCRFVRFNQGNCTGTIDLYQSHPQIFGCIFTYNTGPAVLSGANGASSPQITNCMIYGNATSNSNMPQINLGTSGTDSIRIVNCSISGTQDLTQVGGIAITTLAGGSLKARIEENFIDLNRYGITQYGNNIGSIIRNNDILYNNTQGDPMLGGSGINFYGNSTNQSIVTGNVIYGNLWGITIQNSAMPNLGQLEGSIINPGMNELYSNGNSGEIYDLYNNTPNPVMAENNYWGTMDPEVVEAHIFHQPDNASLGLVDYFPLYDIYTGITENFSQKVPVLIRNISPNPASNEVLIKLNPEIFVSGNLLVEILSLDGKILSSESFEPSNNTVQMQVNFIPEGLYLVRIKSGEMVEAKKFLIRR